MATLMTVSNNEGSKRCDKKCYDATSPECDCCCGGMNHGKGLKTAIQNTEQYGKELLNKIKKENPNVTATINAIQESLFN